MEVEGGVDPLLEFVPPVFPAVSVELPLVPPVLPALPALPGCVVPLPDVSAGAAALPVCAVVPVPGATAPWFVPVPVDMPVAVPVSPPLPPPQAARRIQIEDVVSVLEGRNMILPVNECR